jgi:hypothetical protein
VLLGEANLFETALIEVKKTWELSLDDFELENPDWDDFVDSIVARVSSGLGIDATGENLSADLDKMLLYEEGAIFQPIEEYLPLAYLQNYPLTLCQS